MSDEGWCDSEALILEIAAGGAVVALNLIANRLPGHVQLPANLAAAGLAALLARRAGVAWEDQGLHPRDVPRGARAGITVASTLATITAAGLLAPGAGGFYQDERIVRASTRQMVYQVFVRIPFATALPEEVIFRGSLLGLLTRRRSPVAAAALSSLLFGLWHILPTFDRIPTNPGTRHAHGDPRRTALVLAGHVTSTTLMGLGLSWLRLRSKSTVAPILAHATPNAVGFLGGWAIAHAPQIRRRLARAVRRSIESGTLAPAPTRPDDGVETAAGSGP
ncbi:MAG: lysostaphin resistance A-like protein [Dehalococcoidia bacterium]